MYEKPIKSPILADLNPDTDKLISAYQRRTGYKITLDPASSVNALNLTTQVPAKLTFLTNGKSQVVDICGTKLHFVHATHKKIVGTGTSVALVVQALYYFGRDLMPKKMLLKLAKNLTPQDLKLLASIKNKTMSYVSLQIDQMVSHVQP